MQGRVYSYFIFEMLKEKIWAHFQRIMELFTQKIVTKLSKIWVCDPGSRIRGPKSGIRRNPIPDPGVKKAPDPGSGSATRKKMAVVWSFYLRFSPRGSETFNYRRQQKGFGSKSLYSCTIMAGRKKIYLYLHNVTFGLSCFYQS